MNMIKNGIWITKNYVEYYGDSSKKGLRCFYKKIEMNTKEKIKKFIKYLNRYYFFPIRCNIYFCDSVNLLSYDKKKCKGVFFEGDDENKIFPRIYVPALITPSWDEISIFMTIVRLLTYYFQWYFYENEKRTNRSLEIEASKWAKYIVYLYMSENNIRY